MNESSFLSPATAIVVEHVARLSHKLDLANGELQHARGLVEAAQGEADRAGRELGRAKDEVRALLRENATLRSENAALQQVCLECLTAKEQLARLRSALEEIIGKRGWMLLKRAETVRARLSREPTIAGRCWRFGARLFKRVVKSARSTIALSIAAARRSRRRSSLDRSSASRDNRNAADRDAGAPRPLTTFHELPWRRIGVPVRVGRAPRGYYKILLIAPAEDSPSELAHMLRFAEGLSRCADLDCRIVLEGRSDVSDAFARIVPTLELDALREHGIARARRRG